MWINVRRYGLAVKWDQRCRAVQEAMITFYTEAPEDSEKAMCALKEELIGLRDQFVKDHMC